MKICIKYSLLIWLALTKFTVSGQQIIWEKNIGWLGPDEITSVTESDSGRFFGLGFSLRYGLNQSGLGSFRGASLIKFNSNGDTLFTRNLNLYCQSWGTPYIGKFWNNQYVAVINVELPTSPSPSGIKRFPAVLLINEQGEVVQSRFFPQHEFCIINGVAKTPDNGLVLSGYKSSLDVFHTDSMFAMKVNFLLEQEWANKYTNIANAAYRGEHLEPMANGNYLVSGKLGKRIYGMELDSNGTLVNEKIYYQTPSNRVLNEGKLYQGFGMGFIHHGYYLDGSNNTVGFFGRQDKFGNKIWGGEIPINNVNDFVVNREGTFIVAINGFESSISRFTKDSTLLWKVSLGIGWPLKFVNGLLFTKPDTGLVFGYYQPLTGNLGQQFWIAKIAGVGTAYDPVYPEDTVTISIQEKIFRPKDAPILYPNPTAERIQFKKLSQKTLLSIYSTKGKKLFEKYILPYEFIDVCPLEPGAYLYHLTMGERVFTGKFLKK